MGTPGWRVAGTSVAGPCHANDDCQDRHHIHVTSGGVLIAVVSDGAGSARYAAEGAALLCHHVGEALGRAIGRSKPKDFAALSAAVEQGVSNARVAAEALGAERGAGLDAFHATLVGAVAAPGKGGLFFHIGDGAALAIAPDTDRWLLSPPHNGEYADTTYFFTESDWQSNLRFSPIDPGFETIFVMSDGVTELGLKGTQPHMPFFEPIGRYLAGATRAEGELALRATLDSEAVRERTNDDKTLVWAQAAR